MHIDIFLEATLSLLCSLPQDSPPQELQALTDAMYTNLRTVLLGDTPWTRAVAGMNGAPRVLLQLPAQVSPALWTAVNSGQGTKRTLWVQKQFGMLQSQGCKMTFCTWDSVVAWSLSLWAIKETQARKGALLDTQMLGKEGQCDWSLMS